MPAPFDLERVRHKARERFRRDQGIFLEGVHVAGEDSFVEEFADGFAQGLEEGYCLGLILAYQEAMKLPLTPREDLLALSLAVLKARVAAVNQQLDATGYGVVHAEKS